MENKIILPSNAYYSCRCCGDCCSKWQITLNDKELERFSQTDWGRVFANKNPQSLQYLKDGVCEPLKYTPTQHAQINNYVKAESDLKHQFKMRADEKCLFLGADNLCVMHGEFGIDYKAFTCKSFPVKLLHLSDGTVLASLSFFCPGVAGADENPLTIEHIQNLLKDENDIITLSDRLNFFADVEIDFETMQIINNFIGDFLFKPENASHHNDLHYTPNEAAWKEYGSTMKFDDRMTAALCMILALSKLSKKLRDENPQSFQETFKRDYLKPEALIALLNKCIESAAEAKTQPYAALILMAFISLQQVNKKEYSGFKKAFAIVSNIIKYGLKKGNFTFTETGLNFKMADHYKVKFDMGDAEVIKYAERYISHSIYRKKFFYSCGLLMGHQFIFVFFCLIKWYAKAFALSRKDFEVKGEDVINAVRLIERNFVHTSLISALDSNKQFSNFFTPLLQNFSIIKSLAAL